CVEVEVAVAEAADVEARERAAERGFDQQTRHARGQELDVVARGLELVELRLVDRGDRDRNLLHVLDALFGGDRDDVELLRFAGSGGVGLLRVCADGCEGTGDRGGQQQRQRLRAGRATGKSHWSLRGCSGWMAALQCEPPNCSSRWRRSRVA